MFSKYEDQREGMSCVPFVMTVEGKSVQEHVIQASAMLTEHDVSDFSHS